MAVNYITIDDMTQVPQLSPNDKFLVAKSDGSATGYATYQVTLRSLSNAITCDITDDTRDVMLINSLYDSAPAAAESKAPSYNVLLSVYNYVKQISSQYLKANTLAQKDVSADVNFAVVSPKVKDVNVTAANVARAVNCGVLSGYVAQTAKAKTVSGSSKSYVYRILNSGTFSSDDEYENQTKSVITLKRSTSASKPIIHRCSKNSLVIIQAYSMGNNFAMFTPRTSSSSTTKAAIAAGWSNMDMNMIDADRYYMQVQAQAGTYLCFFNNGMQWDPANCKYKPKAASFANGDIVRIDEYS